MTDRVKISQMNEIINATDNDVIPITQDGQTHKIKVSNLLKDVESTPPDLSGLVPYTGATTKVDLGSHQLTVGKDATVYTIGNVSSVSAPDFDYNGRSDYWNDGYGYGISVYAYKNTPAGKVFSTTPAESSGNDNGNSDSSYTIIWTWTAVVGADGYRILPYNDYNGFSTGDVYIDIPDLFWEDDSQQGYYSPAVVTPTSITNISAEFKGKVKVDDTLLVDGTINASNFSGTSRGTNTGDQNLSDLVNNYRQVNGHRLNTDVIVTKADVGLGSVDNTSDSYKNQATYTLTNKRILPRIYLNSTVTSLTPSLASYDIYELVSQSTAISINMSVTGHYDGEIIEIRIRDNGSSRAITWTGNVAAKAGIPLPTATSSGKVMTMILELFAAYGTWNLMALGKES
jgi:hypothetical protein